MGMTRSDRRVRYDTLRDASVPLRGLPQEFGTRLGNMYSSTALTIDADNVAQVIQNDALAPAEGTLRQVALAALTSLRS